MITVEKIVDVETGEENLVEREMTEQEIADRNKFILEIEQEKAQAQAQAAAKAALLERLGITEEEAKLLLG